MSIILLEYRAAEHLMHIRLGEAMHPLIRANGDGARAADFASRTVATPFLVVCPIFGAAAMSTPEAAEQIYRLALELARAAVLPTAYDRASIVSLN
jgi:hypothetical protein